MAVDDEDLAASVAAHLVDGLLQEGQLRGEAVGDGAGLLARLEDLAEVVLGEDHGVLLLNGVGDGEAHVDEVGAQTADARRAFSMMPKGRTQTP